MITKTVKLTRLGSDTFMTEFGEHVKSNRIVKYLGWSRELDGTGMNVQVVTAIVSDEPNDIPPEDK